MRAVVPAICGSIDTRSELVAVTTYLRWPARSDRGILGKKQEEIYKSRRKATKVWLLKIARGQRYCSIIFFIFQVKKNV